MKDMRHGFHGNVFEIHEFHEWVEAGVPGGPPDDPGGHVWTDQAVCLFLLISFTHTDRCFLFFSLSLSVSPLEECAARMSRRMLGHRRARGPALLS